MRIPGRVMKAIKGLEYPRNPLFPEESLPLHFLYFTFLFQILVLSKLYSLSFHRDSIQPLAYQILRSYTSIQGKEGIVLVERKPLFCRNRCRNQFRVDRGGSASDQRPIAGPPPGYITKAILWFCLRYRNPPRIGTTAEAYRCFRRGSRIPEVHHSFDQ
jgi:hypothetical protein